MRVLSVTYTFVYWLDFDWIQDNKTINIVACIKNNVWNTSYSFQLLLVVQKIVSLVAVLLSQPVQRQRS